MTGSSLYFAALALVAGVGIPLMASINGALGVRLASTTGAAAVLFLGAFLISIVALLINGLPTLQAARSASPVLYIGGVFVAFYVLSITWLVPRFGVGNAIFFVLFGQIISASLIDHFGWFNAVQTPLSMTRVLGIVLMLAGLFLSRRIV